MTTRYTPKERRPGGEGMTRRQLIRASLVAGVAAWTAPTIITSLASPAAAASGGGGLPTGCSYALIVFTYKGGTYIMKIEKGSSSCAFENSTSDDSDMGSAFPCGGHEYTGGKNHGKQIWQDGAAVSAAVPGSLTCSDLFTVSDNVVTTNSVAVNIIFGVSHHGSTGGWNDSHFFPICPDYSGTITLDCG